MAVSISALLIDLRSCRNRNCPFPSPAIIHSHGWTLSCDSIRIPTSRYVTNARSATPLCPHFPLSCAYILAHRYHTAKYIFLDTSSLCFSNSSINHDDRVQWGIQLWTTHEVWQIDNGADTTDLPLMPEAGGLLVQHPYSPYLNYNVFNNNSTVAYFTNIWKHYMNLLLRKGH